MERIVRLLIVLRVLVVVMGAWPELAGGSHQLEGVGAPDEPAARAG